MVSVDRDVRGGRTARGIVAGAVAASLALLTACGSGGSDGSNKGNPSAPKASGHLGIMQTKKIATVGVVNQPPFSGVSPTGKAIGASPALAKQILYDLGVGKMKPVVGEYGDMIPGVNANRWDFIGASLVVTPQRCSQVLFSDPIVSDYVRIAYKNGTSPPTSLKALIANPNLKLGLLTGSTYVKTFESAGLPASRVVEFNDIRSGMDGVLAGRVAALAGSATGFKITGIDSKIRLTGRLTDVPPSVSAFAFKKSDTAMRDAFNGDLKRLIANGQYVKIMQKAGFTGNEIKGMSTQKACAAKS